MKKNTFKFAAASAFEEYKMIFPIPQAQILSMGMGEDGTPYLTQNPGYYTPQGVN